MKQHSRHPDHAMPEAGPGSAPAVLMRDGARWFLIVLALGLLLRSAFVWLYSPGPFSWSSLLHAHSHTAYFGWTGLGLMGLILHVLPGLTGRPLGDSRALTWLLRLAPIAVGGALISFAWQGYGAFSIAFSSLNEVVWFCFAAVFWGAVKHRPVREWSPALWLIGTAVALLLLSAVGTLLIILFDVALKVSNPVLGNSGIYLFLQAYGDGWLEVGLMGVTAALLGGLPSRALARWQALLLLTLMAPAALRLLVPYGLTGPLLWVGTLAGVGLGVAQILFLLNIRSAWGRVPAAVRPWWGLAAAALVLKAGLELVPLLPGWEVWAGERQLVIAFLHLKLLALVSAALIGALGFIGRIGGRWSWWAFSTGTPVMVGALAAHGLWAGATPALSQPLYVLSFVAGIAAALGAAGAVWPRAIR